LAKWLPIIVACLALAFVAAIHARRRAPVDVQVRPVRTTDYRIADCMIGGGIVLFDKEGQPMGCKGR